MSTSPTLYTLSPMSTSSSTDTETDSTGGSQTSEFITMYQHHSPLPGNALGLITPESQSTACLIIRPLSLSRLLEDLARSKSQWPLPLGTRDAWQDSLDEVQEVVTKLGDCIDALLRERRNTNPPSEQQSEILQSALEKLRTSIMEYYEDADVKWWGKVPSLTPWVTTTVSQLHTMLCSRSKYSTSSRQPTLVNFTRAVNAISPSHLTLPVEKRSDRRKPEPEPTKPEPIMSLDTSQLKRKGGWRRLVNLMCTSRRPQTW